MEARGDFGTMHHAINTLAIGNSINACPSVSAMHVSTLLLPKDTIYVRIYVS